MAKPGPKPRPVELKRRLGNPGKESLPNPDDVVLLAAPDTPPEPSRTLGTAGAKEWTRVWQEARWWLSGSDAHAVLLYCEAVDDYVIARHRLIAIQVGEETEMQEWRARKQVKDAREQVTSLAARLGLDPVSRSELGVAEVRIQEGLANLMTRDGDTTVRTIDV